MNDAEAKALGRWCDRHNRRCTRVHFPDGAQSTMCPECAKDDEFADAIKEMTRIVIQAEKRRKGRTSRGNA
jgi:hypothetical protein